MKRWIPTLNLHHASERAWGAMLLWICLSPMFAYVLPDRPLSTWSWAVGFADFVARLVPSIDVLTQLSSMPEVTRFFMALQWTVFGPICIVLLTGFNRLSLQSTAMAMKVGEIPWWAFLLAAPAMAAFAWALWAFPFVAAQRPNARLVQMATAMGESRLWLALFGSALVMCCAFAIFALLKSPGLIRLAYAVRSRRD